MNKPQTFSEDFEQQIAKKIKRRIRAKQQSKNLWFGLTMFGMVGWSVVIPILISIAIGIWIDKTFPSQYSWTLMCMFIGVVLGCFNGWYWISKEAKIK